MYKMYVRKLKYKLRYYTRIFKWIENEIRDYRINFTDEMGIGN